MNLTTSSSNNKTYPLLNLISTDNPSSFTGGVSATSADLSNITWNDKPSVGFTSQTHRFCFNIGTTQPYKSGYPHTYTLATSADAFAINVAPTPTSACLYLVSDTINKMMFNTNTPYSSSYGTAPVALRNSNVYIKASNALNDGSSSYDMSLFIESSNTSPVSFAFQLNNGANTTSTNAAYFYIWELKVSGVHWSMSSTGVSIKASNAILAGAGVYTTSDARIKKDFAPVDDSAVEGMLKVEPILYRCKNQDESIPLQLGYKTQDLIRQGLPHCIKYVEVEKRPIDDKETDLENVQYSVDYSKIEHVALRQEAVESFHELFTCMKLARNDSFATRIGGVSGQSSTTVMLCTVTKVYGTLEEVAELYVSTKSRIVLDFAKTKRLVDLAHPSPEHPLRSGGLRWSSWKTISKFVSDRDLCYLEYMDAFVDKQTGRRGWARCTKSIDHACCPASPLPNGPIRAELFCSGLIFQETNTPGVLELSTLVHVDTKNVPSWIGREVLKWRKKNALNLNHVLKITRRMKAGANRVHVCSRLVDHNGKEVRICRSCHDQISKWSRTRRCRQCEELLCKRCSAITYQDASEDKHKCSNRLCTDCSLSLDDPYDDSDEPDVVSIVNEDDLQLSPKPMAQTELTSASSFYFEQSGRTSLSSLSSTATYDNESFDMLEEPKISDCASCTSSGERELSHNSSFKSRPGSAGLFDLSYLDAFSTKS
ncbi:TPA: hypothetical protein N0F65_007339 [Lagenidium giganteum]|uniref:FYVE-type domain-containing protein n=1 Tax=Lagenidium giganteum TaxID=4803 RepID=A0AAV2Z6Y8_9STRA|nr:TPA: hypothetical protein N0F65_007339 [Lagenidium giganteum]